MGCFIVPTTAAVMTTALGRHVPKHMHVNWLNYLLWGGSAGLAIEHIAHGEYPWTMTGSALGEMATVGIAMLVGCVGLWLAMVYVHNKFIAKRTDPA